jgi:hypothetical protein
MNSIIAELISWASKNECELRKNGIHLTKNFPEEQSKFPWKASLGFEKNDLVASYTMWERNGLQTELIIVDGSAGRTLLTEDGNPESPGIVGIDLGNLVRMLLNPTKQF